MKKSLIVWAALAGLSIIFFEEPVHAQRPNVVLMLVDNLGFGDLSSYNGGTRGGMRTPNIDRLASEGMRMTQFPRRTRVYTITGRFDDRAILHSKRHVPGYCARRRGRTR